MSLVRTLIFFISLIGITSLCAQENAEANTSTRVLADSISYKEKYGLRVGIDLYKPLRTILDDAYSGFEISGDYRFNKKLFIAAELGNEKNDYQENNLNATTNGSYIKAGINYNAYDNWIGMTNEIFVGLRYGFATFTQELNSYAIYTDEPYYAPDIVTEGLEFNGLTASWLELQVGVKAELINNVYLALHAQLKRQVTEDTPTNFDNLFIPGFGRTYDDSPIGVGFGYSISYLIPIFKKTETQKNFAK